jgi:prephenate dehydrogenase
VAKVAAGVAEAVIDAELVFVAAPVSGLGDALDAVLAAAPADCAVSDVGSTKRSIVEGRADQRFIGGHPLAGAETAGVEHARADLFEGATWYLTPGAATSGALYERLHKALVGIGAQPTAIDAAVHDRVMASVSHLPHVFANVLVAQAARALGDGAEVPATGPSFRDATRVAGANAAIWPDIYLSNSDALIALIDETQARLAEVRGALAGGDRAAIERWNEGARADRDALLGAGLAGGSVHELRAAVTDRPGVVAEIALALGRAQISIVDIALSPSRDGGQGLVALWVRGEEQAQRAVELIEALAIPVARA